jgi:hypothetical protein
MAQGDHPSLGDNSAIVVEERYVTEINMSTEIDNFSKKFVAITDFPV